MSKRNALLVAIVAAVVVAVLFLWPERARADFAASVRLGGSVGVHDVGGRLHRGSSLRGRLHAGHGALHGRLHRGGHDFRGHGFRRGHLQSRHGVLLGDRFRLKQQRRVGGPPAKGVLLGDRFRFEQHRRLHHEFRGPDHRRGRHGHGRHRHDRLDRKAFRHGGKWLRPAPLLLPYVGADVIVREVVVPVLVPVPSERPADLSRSPGRLDPRGRVTLVGEEDGIVGDWAQGDLLPDSVPHVTLDAVAYGLPQPPLGEKYARVGNDVLRIDAGSRRIVEVVAR